MFVIFSFAPNRCQAHVSFAGIGIELIYGIGDKGKDESNAIAQL
jgi:hypothetical protein